MTNKLAIGTVQFGLDYGVSNSLGKINKSEVCKIVDFAHQAGIDTYDTAPSYGNSEQVLGEVLGGKDCIITKTPSLPSADTGNIISYLDASYESSLKNLKQNCVHGLLVHNADDLLRAGGNKIYEWLSNKKINSQVSKIGVSIYSADQLDKILELYSIDLVQLPLNILDQRLIHSGHLAKLKDLGIEVHVRSVFLQGLLLMNQDEIPEYFAKYKKLLFLFHKECEMQNVSPIELSLRFVMSLDNVDKVIVGVNSRSQLAEIVESSNTQLFGKDFLHLSTSDLGLVNPSLWKM